MRISVKLCSRSPSLGSALRRRAAGPRTERISPSLESALRRRAAGPRAERRSQLPRLRTGRAQTISRSSVQVDRIVIKPTAKHPAHAPSPPGVCDVGGASTIATDFSELWLRAEVVRALEGIGISKPTVIQMLAIPKILRGKNVLCAAETGSGKTLAYLSPLVSRLREEEEECGVVARLRRPRALILLPSRDLAAQVLSVAKSLSHVARFRAVGLIGGVKRRYIKEALEKPVDLAIATPASLLKFRREEQVKLSDLSHLVIDEADSMFDSSFQEATTSIIKSIEVRSKKPPLPPTRAEGVQVVVVGATLSNKMLRKVDALIPNTKKVSSKRLHQILPNVKQVFVKVRQDEKADSLVDFLRASSPSDVAMVFCNTVPSCDWTARFLQERGIPATKLHAGFSAAARKNLLKDFTDGRSRVLVCTDIASRGIDAAQVNHVVLFDFPNTMADYLHRVGRTGRVGSREDCRATVFMSHRRDVRVAWKIKDAADQRTSIMNRRVSRRLDLMSQPSSGRRVHEDEDDDLSHAMSSEML